MDETGNIDAVLAAAKEDIRKDFNGGPRPAIALGKEPELDALDDFSYTAGVRDELKRMRTMIDGLQKTVDGLAAVIGGLIYRADCSDGAKAVHENAINLLLKHTHVCKDGLPVVTAERAVDSFRPSHIDSLAQATNRLAGR